jgi:3-hydroxyacyl-[acyl-carrier-protein] dehydratase
MNQAITDFIPQRPPIVMIDRLIQSDLESATSAFTILPTNIFVDDGKFTEPGLIENIAQTAAAMVGYQSSLQQIPTPIGYIASIKDLSIKFLPDVLSTIRTTINVTNTVMDVTIIKGMVEQNEKIVCSCEMRILIQKN